MDKEDSRKKKIRETQLKNMLKWNEEDYHFYNDFINDIFPEEKQKSPDGRELTREEGWLRFKNWQEFKKSELKLKKLLRSTLKNPNDEESSEEEWIQFKEWMKQTEKEIRKRKRKKKK